MEYIKETINNYNVHFVKTKKFKDNYINIRFTSAIDDEKYNYYEFLSQLLLESTKTYDEKQLIIKTQDLYDLKVYSSVNKIGKNVAFDFKFKFLNKKYSNNNIDKNSLDLIFDILFNINVKNNKFVDFEKTKRRLHEDILRKKESKETICARKCLSDLDKNNPISYFIDNVDDIDCDKLIKYYENLITSNVDLFVIGNIDIEFYKNYFNDIKFVNKKSYDEFFYSYENEETNNKLIEIKNDLFKQASLNLGYKINNLTEYERFYVLPLYNIIIGGSANSKLFKNVREKNSLAYYCNSIMYDYNNVMLIKSGIDYSNLKKCIKIIEKQLSSKIYNTELNIAKKILIARYNNIFNNFNKIVNYYYELSMFNKDNYDLEKLKKVSIDDLNNLKSKVKNVNKVVVYGNQQL